MIQRVQTIWLLLASLTILCYLFIPLVVSNFNGIEYYITVSGLYQKTGSASKQIEAYTPLLAGTIALALLCFLNIFNYRKRNTQKNAALVCTILIIGLSLWANTYAKNIPGSISNGNYSTGMLIISPIAILFLLLAVRNIRKDEKLIKSADRLR